MENGHLHDDKLFRAVHDRLSDYEAPSNGADWDAMSRALDSLPKTARYKWKISLNTILVIVGLMGVSALSFALVTKKGDAPESKPTTQAIVTTPIHTQEQKRTPAPVNHEQTVAPVQNSFADNNEFGITNVSNVTTTNGNAATTNTTIAKTDGSSTTAMMSADGSVKKRKKQNQLLFGDQIDPKKGFIYNTKENPNVITTPIDPAPNVFYDSENGQIKKIEIKKDSASTKGPRRSKTDSTANIFSPGVPTESGPAGFDTE